MQHDHRADGLRESDGEDDRPAARATEGEAAGKAHRLSAGGPGQSGGSGIDFVKGWAPGLSADIRNRFDIVGFDPRGVGGSNPSLQCHDNLQGLTGLEPYPRTQEQWQTIAKALKDFADLCNQRGGDLLNHVGTLNVVRDMDRIRQALGDEKLTYFGYSYGSVLGQAYEDYFPNNVRAIVIDGPVDTTLGLDQLGIEQSQGFEGALQRWAADCKAHSCTPTSTATRSMQ